MINLSLWWLSNFPKLLDDPNANKTAKTRIYRVHGTDHKKKQFI